MSRRDNDGGHTTASGDGEDAAIPSDEAAELREPVADDEGALELEVGEWVGATEAAATSQETSEKGWLGRVFGRSKGDEPAADPGPGIAADPGELAVFPAVTAAGDQVGDPSSDDPDAPTPQARAWEDTPAAEEGDERQPAELQASETEPDLAAADEPGQSSFSDLWSAGDDDDSLGDDVIDFSTFTSEDYLQATTREYAGLAEAVAKAEEEGTQQIAVSAEIPGLESGLVGLEDVVTAAGEDADAHVVEPQTGSDLSVRVLTAVGLVILFAASLLSPYGIGALVVVVLGIAAGEMFAALIRGGYRPLSIFGFLGVAGAFFGTWIAGPVAIPMALLLTAIAVFLFFATVPGRRAPLENATMTILVTVWIGGLGGFAFDFLGSPDYQWLVLALVITVALMDIGQYFIGRRFGRRSLAPIVSPKKTVEGYVAGLIVAIGVGAAFALTEPFDLTDGLVIGATVAIVAPVGDLAVSVLKRALGVKDMGYILPGHGGVLDRVDAMIITIPAFWIAYSWMGLLT